LNVRPGIFPDFHDFIWEAVTLNVDRGRSVVWEIKFCVLHFILYVFKISIRSYVMGGWNIILYLSFTSFRVSIIYVDTGFVEMKYLLDTMITMEKCL